MTERDDAVWRGLWHAAPGRARLRDQWREHAVVYGVVPLAIALLQAPSRGWLGGLIDTYPRVAITVLCVGGALELQYALWSRGLRRPPSWPLRALGHGLAVAVAVVVGSWLAAWAWHGLWGDPAPAVRSWLSRQVAVLTTAIVVVMVALDELNARARALAAGEARARLAVLRAELAALQARTDPHFLFNSLNTVAALIPEDAARAEVMLERLAAIFRYTLEAGRRATVALDDELAAVTAYLEVEAERLGDRLRWRVDRDAGGGGLAVPPLLLQPLVENAVRHGAGARRGATLITVSVRRDGDALRLSVEDRPVDAGEVARSSTPGAGTALADLRARLALAYGGRATLAAAAVAPAGWRAEVVLPAAAS